jgi:preprotein translocase subunit SecA
VKKIIEFEEKYNNKTLDEISIIINNFKKYFEEGKETESIRNESIAIIREVIYRFLNLKLFPSQILGSIVLDDSNIAQMNTGEGKTITAIAPICLNAFEGKKIYLMTVNNYLAKRD